MKCFVNGIDWAIEDPCLFDKSTPRHFTMGKQMSQATTTNGNVLSTSVFNDSSTWN